MTTPAPVRRACAACGGDAVTPVFRQQFARMDAGSLLGGYDVVTCDACGFAFADGIPAQAALDAYYREFSKYENAAAIGAESASDRARFAETAALLTPALRQGARVLEFGCASGGLLRELARAGAEVRGVDPSPACAKAAKTLHGVEVQVGSIFDGLYANERFDAIVAVGVLEHLRDLSAAFGVLRSHLGPGGLLFVEVPDATRFAEHAVVPFQQFSLEHINFLTPASLAAVAAREGFSPVRIDQPVRDTGRRGREPVVCGLFKRDDAAKAPGVDREGPEALRRYVGWSEAREAPVRRKLEALAASGREVVVWGAGTQALRLLATSALGNVRIAAFIDGNARYHGRTLAGAPIRPPSEIQRFSQPILIASTGFQDDIAAAIRDRFHCSNELVLLDDAPARNS